MDWTVITPHIRAAVEALESEIPKLVRGSKEHAKAQLAWHHLMDAHNLLVKGEMTVEDFRWAIEQADKITTGSKVVPT